MFTTPVIITLLIICSPVILFAAFAAVAIVLGLMAVPVTLGMFAVIWVMDRIA